MAITVASTPLVAGSATGASVDPLQTAEGRIDQTVLKGVVKITSSPKKLEETTIGTGFFVSQEIQEGTRAVYLVTNKHVVSDWDVSDGSITHYSTKITVFFYRISDSGGTTYRSLTIDLVDASGRLLTNKVAVHPNRSIDVAIVRLDRELDPANKIDLLSFDRSFLIPFNNTVNWAGLGTQVFALGYPLGISSLINNYPIAKAGYVSSIAGQEFKIEIPVQNRAGRSVVAKIEDKFVVVDGLIVPGNSGGPVVIPAETRVRTDPVTNQFQFTKEPTKNLVIGMVSMGLGGSGLTLVLSSDYIIELLDKLK